MAVTEVMSPVSSWFCLVVGGLASEVGGGQKQFEKTMKNVQGS